LEEAKTKIKAFFVLDTLEYVQFGGRIGKVAAALGSVLHLKPIITFDEEGKLSPHTLARGKKQAFKKMLEPLFRQINETRSSIAILHSKAEEEARAIKERLKGQENVCELYIGSIGPALSVHAGPGLIGIVVAPFSSTHSN
jgi:DegV family protein with EDD domain